MLHEDIFHEALAHLERERKVSLFEGNSGDLGIKFA